MKKMNCKDVRKLNEAYDNCDKVNQAIEELISRMTGASVYVGEECVDLYNEMAAAKKCGVLPENKVKAILQKIRQAENLLQLAQMETETLMEQIDEKLDKHYNF